MTRNSFKFDPFAEDALNTLKNLAAHFQEQSKNPKEIYPPIDDITIRSMQTHMESKPNIYNAVAFHERPNGTHTLISLTHRADILMDNIMDKITDTTNDTETQPTESIPAVS